MFERLIRDFAVLLFGLGARLGLYRKPILRRAFLALYSIYKRYFEAGPIERLREFVPTGSLVLDVGANVGFFSLRFAEWVGDSGEVISIEPEDQNYNTLISTLKSAGFLNRVRTIKAVATATSGDAFLEINPLHPADHKLSRDGTGVAVKAVTLDGLIGNKSALRPVLVKVDVQGAEMLVLQGASKILKISKPALFVELHEDGLKRFDTSVSAILDHLSQCGYEAYWLMRKGPHVRASDAEIHARVAQVGYVDVLFRATA